MKTNITIKEKDLKFNNTTNVIEKLFEKNGNDEKINFQINKMLSDIGKSLTTSRNHEDIYDKFYQELKNVIQFDAFAIRMFDSENQTIHYTYEVENKQKLEVYFKQKLNRFNNFTSWSIYHKKPVFISDFYNEYQSYLKDLQPMVDNSYQSVIFIPLIVMNEVLAVITIQSLEKYAYSKTHLQLLETLGSYCAIALENSRLLQSLEGEVQKRTREIEVQKKVIEQSNKDLTDSILYAKRIQDAILPDSSLFNKHFAEHFIIFKPKDIVSGDFYWAYENGSSIYLAVADCTGHGVPGALLSITANNALNQCIIEQQLTKPSEILDALRIRIIEAFNSTASVINDGLDISLIKINKKEKSVEYSGANNSIYWINQSNKSLSRMVDKSTLKSSKIKCDSVGENNLIEIKSDKQPIGRYINESPFTNHVFKPESNDTIYLFSDGYSDQFGGVDNKKFKTHNLKRLLKKLQIFNLNDQCELATRTFNSWKGCKEQIDDMTMIGIKINWEHEGIEK